MKRVVLLVALFAVVFGATLVAALPLGFVLERMNLADRRISWAIVQGTVWNGRVSGLYYGSQPIGDVRTSLRLRDLLRAQIAYDVDVSGPVAMGEGIVVLGQTSSIRAREVDIELRLQALTGLHANIREIGGHLNIRNGHILMDRSGCLEASGNLTSDLATNLAATFGQSWPEAAGHISCERKVLRFVMTGEGPLGEEFRGEGRIGSAETTLEAMIGNAGPELGYGLALIGFVPDDGSYILRWNSDDRQVTP